MASWRQQDQGCRPWAPSMEWNRLVVGTFGGLADHQPGSSVEDIAEAAGFSIGALYSNFANKEELFLELSTTYNADRIAEASEALLARNADPDEAIGAVSRLLVDAADKD